MGFCVCFLPELWQTSFLTEMCKQGTALSTAEFVTTNIWDTTFKIGYQFSQGIKTIMNAIERAEISHRN